MAWAKLKTSIVAGLVILAAAGTSIVTVQHLQSKRLPPPAATSNELNPNAASALDRFSHTPAGAVSFSSVKFIKSLKLAGKLPGIVSNTPVGIEIPWLNYERPGGSPHFVETNPVYPLTLTLTVHANSVNGPCYYTITKASETNEWQMQKAWLSGTNGNVLKEHPVP
jgi:hypothetical protein